MSSDAAAREFYVAIHWPPAHIVMRAEMDGADLSDLREQVLTSVRDALDTMDVEIVEESNYGD